MSLSNLKKNMPINIETKTMSHRLETVVTASLIEKSSTEEITETLTYL